MSKMVSNILRRFTRYCDKDKCTAYCPGDDGTLYVDVDEATSVAREGFDSIVSDPYDAYVSSDFQGETLGDIVRRNEEEHELPILEED